MSETLDLPVPLPRLRRWMLGTVLPWWADRALDPGTGLFREHLSPSGEPLADPVRVRVIARQTYVFAHAATLSEKAGFRDLAQRGLDALLGPCAHADGGWVHRLAPDGSVLDATRDLYDHAFILLALGWAARATGDQRARAAIDEGLAFLDDRLADPVREGLFYEAIPPEGAPETVLPRRQNPHMHLLEAFLNLHQTRRKAAFITRARAVMAHMPALFVDDRTTTIREFFTDDWNPAPGDDGLVRHPGHAFEWIWLLDQYRHTTGDNKLTDLTSRLYEVTCSESFDRREGHVFAVPDETNARGRVLRATKRLWNQTEALKALCVGHASFADAWAKPLAERLLDSLFRFYLDPESGGYVDQIDEVGQPIAEKMPASTLYHLFVASLAVQRAFAR